MNIIDNHNLLAPGQKTLLCTYAAEPFRIGNFTSLDDILTQLNVDVVIEPGIVTRSVPPELYDAEKHWRNVVSHLLKYLDWDRLLLSELEEVDFWRDVARRIEESLPDSDEDAKVDWCEVEERLFSDYWEWRNETDRLEENPDKFDDDFPVALEDLKDAIANSIIISAEIKELINMPLRGCYVPKKNIIMLYPEEMQQEYAGKCVDILLVSTLAHETMHAYFDRPGHEKFPYVVHVEEPLAEFGKLLYMYSISPTSSLTAGSSAQNNKNKDYNWVYNDVKGKRTCYRYGAFLMDQHLGKGPNSSERQYLEEYKVNLICYPMPKVTGNTITLPAYMPNPWLSLQNWPTSRLSGNATNNFIVELFPKCADIDYDKLAAEDQSFIKDIKLNLWPEPFIGNPAANVYILSCNPGYGGADDDLAAQCPAVIKAILDNLSHSSKGFMWFSEALKQFIRRDNDKITYRWPGVEYWDGHTKELRDELGRNPNIMQIEYYPYHSKNKGSCTADKHRLPSFDYTDYLVKEAINAHKLIIVMRCEKAWMNRIPELKKYATTGNIIRPINKQNATLTRGNFNSNDWAKIMANI